MEQDSAIAGISRGSRQARIPDVEEPPKPAEIYEVDHQSYFHVSFSDAETDSQYEGLVEMMTGFVRESKCLPRTWLSHTGLDYIIEYNGRRGGSYVRGRIMYVLEGIEGNPDNRDYVKVQLIDDALEVVVHRTQLFPSSLPITEYAPFVMKCKLESMDMFLDSSVLKELYEMMMSGEMRPMKFPFLPGIVLVQVLSNPTHPMEESVPTVRVLGRTWDRGITLTDIFQQYLPTFKTLEYPKFGECPSVKITHYDGKGDVWFQRFSEGEDYHMTTLIDRRLAAYNDGFLEGATQPKISHASWKIMFSEEPVEGVCGGGGIIHIYKRVSDNKCYRVKKMFKFSEEDKSDERWYVLFVDYGNVDIVPEFNGDERLLISACEVDQNLAIIPPQCIPARFIGASCKIGGHTVVDIRKFWKYLGAEEAIFKVQLKSFKGDDMLGLPPVNTEDDDELLDRMVPAIFVDHGFNFLPLPCTPVTYAPEEGVPKMHEVLAPSSFYENAMNEFDRQKFLMDKRNQPVSLFIEEFITKLERSGGRLDGGLLLPQIDIYVEVKGREEEGLKSLNKIYHTMESCDTHGPKIPFEWDWSLVVPLTYGEKIDGSEVDSGLGSLGDEESVGSKGSSEDGNVNLKDVNVHLEKCAGRSRYSWVDWAKDKFGLKENAKVTEEVPADKTRLPPPKDAIVNCSTGAVCYKTTGSLAGNPSIPDPGIMPDVHESNPEWFSFFHF